MSNSFGKAFRITTWGESHGDAVGVVIDGCPPGLPINLEDIQKELDRRRPGQSEISTQRKEGDKAEILSGVFEGLSLGTPISISVWNTDAKGKDYEHMKSVYRPSHADYTYQAKYGIRNWKGGGRASARETIGRVAAGAIAKKFLLAEYGTKIVAFVKRISDIESNIGHEDITLEGIESNMARCPDQNAAVAMIEAVKTARKNGDSLGGVVEAFATNVPVGIESAEIEHMLMAIGNTDAVPIVRIPSLQQVYIQKALDLGALGIVVPAVKTAEEAAEIVSATRFPPDGKRSWGPLRASKYTFDNEDYLKNANHNILVVLIIETVEAVENLEEIAAVPGIDVLFLGPWDMCLSLGLDPLLLPHREIDQILEKMVKTSARFDVVTGAGTSVPGDVSKRLNQGVKFLSYGPDYALLSAAAISGVDAFKNWSKSVD